MPKFASIVLVVIFSAVTADTARAALILTTDVLITDDDLAGSVQYVPFNAPVAGIYTIEVLGATTLGPGYVSGDSPAGYLFVNDGVLDAGDFIVGDNSDTGDVVLSPNLAVGSYLIAVSEFSLLLSEAVSGINGGNSIQDPNKLLRVRVSTDAIVIPEPATATLGIAGVSGLMMRRRRTA